MTPSFRDATAADLPAIVALLADDPLGAAREGSSDMAPYQAAFRRLEASPGMQLVVGEVDGRVVAYAQLAILPGLSARGRTRAQVEGVRVAAELRSHGLGAALMAECEARARAAGCGVVQLTSDNSRSRAHAFYRRLGFAPSHTGFKKPL